MRSVLLSAIIYTLAVFAVGFALGTIRVLAAAPLIGEGAAVLIELPIMLTVSFFFARWCVRRWQVPAFLVPRLLMGFLAFAILMGLEAWVSIALLDRSVTEHLSHYLDPEAWVGLAGQLVFAAIPTLLLLMRSR
ncbi:MAG: hypothetical protein HKP51_02670 [Sulfitobacter sp.]|nr:hypothetical protein [Sulfitobacter sp.]